MKILGIETSCDETAAAIVTDKKEILSNIVHSQISEHAPYGGVVPEIASRSHINNIEKTIGKAIDEAGISFPEIDAIAATTGPGLIGGLIVGLTAGKAISSALNKPFIAVNHLEGHALTARLTDNVNFPFLLLLVSGGHCQIIIAEDIGKYSILGSTIDDALGEAFDKTAKMLGLGYPGGPIVEKYAQSGDENKYIFPRPLTNQKNCNFSFSGLKTAVFRTIDSIEQKNINDKYDICASFQRACGDVLVNRMENAIAIFKERYPHSQDIVLAGGVAANKYLRNALNNTSDKYNMNLTYPPINLCTDNAAMIAWAGLERFRKNLFSDLKTTPKAKWPLDKLDEQNA